MTRYFAGNTLAAFQRSKATVVESTAGGTFDATYVPASIACPPDGAAYFDSIEFNAVSPAEFWLHFELYNNTGAGDRVYVYGPGGANGFRFDVQGSSTTGRLSYWNTVTAAWVILGTFGIGGGRHRLDLQVIPGVSATLYFEETTVWATGAIPDSQTTFTRARFYGKSAGSTVYYSQMFAEDQDTRGKKYMQAILNAVGSYADGTGAVGDINETVLSDATFAQVTAVGEKRSFTHAGITVPSGLVIGAAVCNARARTGGGVVTDGKLGIDSGATYDGGANLGPGSQLEPIQRIVELDPDTGIAWTEAAFDTSEIVLEAA